MTDEALTTEQLRERIGYTIAGFMLTDGHLIYRADTQIKLRDAILALIASAQGRDVGGRFCDCGGYPNEHGRCVYCGSRSRPVVSLAEDR